MTAAKALTGFILSIVASYFATVGIRPDTTVEELIALIVSVVIMGAGVYCIPNKKTVDE